MHETLYNKIISAKLDYQGDLTITKPSQNTYFVQQWSVGAGGWWVSIGSNIPLEHVNQLLGKSMYRPIIDETFTGRWRYREARPDESTFKDWLRVYYNELECHAEYKSDEEKAYQSIVSLCIGGEVPTIRELRLDVEHLGTDDETTGVQFDLYDELVSAIADYQDEQAKKGTNRE